MRATSRTIKNNMADQNQTHELVSDVLFEDHLVDMWPQYPCLYDVRSSNFKNRDSREKGFGRNSRKVGALAALKRLRRLCKRRTKSNIFRLQNRLRDFHLCFDPPCCF